MKRIVEPEMLDELPPQDRRALRSRRDLRRLNQWMNHPRVMAQVLRENLNGQKTLRLVELGAGDGHFLLSVARRLQRPWPIVSVTFVDRLDVSDSKICKSLQELGWHVRPHIADVFDWLRRSPPNAADFVTANLFLHQFNDAQLAELFCLVAQMTNRFIALEPRRWWLSRLSGNFLWCIGCGSVTRHDGRISIRAGFLERELSSLWPDAKNWELIERPVGLFSHLFCARRKD